MWLDSALSSVRLAVLLGPFVSSHRPLTLIRKSDTARSMPPLQTSRASLEPLVVIVEGMFLRPLWNEWGNRGGLNAG